jgi:hypothetical protein
MTTPEFLRFLGRVSTRFDWILTADTGRHAERRARPRFRLQAVPADTPTRKLDPIRAVAYARTGNIPDTWTEAAAVIGMEMSDAIAVAAAANDRTWTGGEGDRTPAVHRQQIRRRLLEAVGVLAPDEAGDVTRTPQSDGIRNAEGELLRAE